MTDNRPVKGIKKEKPVDAPSLVEKIVDSIQKVFSLILQCMHRRWNEERVAALPPPQWSRLLLATANIACCGADGGDPS